MDQGTKPKQPQNQKEDKKLGVRESVIPEACEPKKPNATKPRLRNKSK